MITTELVTPPRAFGPPDASAPPSFGEMLAETVPLVGFIPVAGPAAVLLAGPWLLLALLLVGYVALLLTVAALLVAAVALVRLLHRLLCAPSRLVRHHYRSARVSLPAAPLLTGELRGGAA